MPFGIDDAIMIGGALLSTFGASKSSKAAQSAADTQAAAADRATQLQSQIYQQTRQDQEPWRQTGVAALNTLNGRFGLPTVSMTGSQPIYSQTYGGMSPSQGSAASAYLAANPDVMAEYQRLSPNNLANNYGITTPEQFAEWHYQTSGQREGRTWGEPAQAGTTSAPTASATYAYDPTAPGGYDITAENYRASPGYDYRVSEGLKAVNTGAAAAGKLMSGQRLKALQTRGDNIADQDFTDWRNYTAGRYDQNTNNLMTMAGFGPTATAATASAGQAAAANTGNLMTGAANAQANGQINSANAWNNGLNNIMTTGAYLYGQGAFGGRSN